MKCNRVFLGAGLIFVLAALICHGLAVWISCDPTGQFGPKGAGTAVVHELFGKEVTPARLALRLRDALGFLTLLTSGAVMAVVGSIKVVNVRREWSAPNPFELDDVDSEPPTRSRVNRSRSR